MHTAHLVLWLRIDGGIPQVIDCKIHSSGPTNLSCMPGVMYAEIMQISAPTYDEADKRMMEICRTTPGLEWTRAFLEEGLDAHMARRTLMSVLRRGMPGYSSHCAWPTKTT